MALSKGTLINRVRRMKDEIEGASESESNLVNVDRKEISNKEEVNEDVSRRGLKQMRQHVAEAPSQHQHHHPHLHPHPHPNPHPHHHQQRHHAPTCLSAKLVNSNEPSPRALKQHQPHCIHHKPTCPKQFAKGAYPSEDSPSETAMPDGKGKSVKYFKKQDKSYLLVEYRPSSSDAPIHPSGANNRHHQHDIRANGRRRQPVYLHNANIDNDAGNNKRTTIKFISQLYFLLHLSVILSLLLHHKNLVISERKSSMKRQAGLGK